MHLHRGSAFLGYFYIFRSVVGSSFFLSLGAAIISVIMLHHHYLRHRQRRLSVGLAVFSLMILHAAVVYSSLIETSPAAATACHPLIEYLDGQYSAREDDQPIRILGMCPIQYPGNNDEVREPQLTKTWSPYNHPSTLQDECWNIIILVKDFSRRKRSGKPFQ